jgi:hypothetical protein
MALSVKKIADHLLKERLRYDQNPTHKGVGLYAYFIDNAFELLPVQIDNSGLIYVGMTEDGFDARSHFIQKSSGFSTLRRTLGAVLKHRLELQATPRGAASTPANIRNYSFTPEGEERLSEWMQKHLTYSNYASDESPALLEKDVIRHLCPPLCLTAWKNKQALMIKAMHKACSEEAQALLKVRT